MLDQIQNFVFENYLAFKSIHLIAVMAFMAGMLYLPRLYVYHARAEAGSDLSETLKVMERRLLRGIINPAFIVMLVIGVIMLWSDRALLHEGWLHAKLALVFLLGGVHGLYSKWRKVFERDENLKSDNFYRVWNEVPTVFMIFIVFLAVMKPF